MRLVNRKRPHTSSKGFLIVRAVLPADETLALQRWRPVGNALALCTARALSAARFRRNTTDGGA